MLSHQFEEKQIEEGVRGEADGLVVGFLKRFRKQKKTLKAKFTIKAKLGIKLTFVCFG